MSAFIGISAHMDGRQKTLMRLFHGGNTGSIPVGRANFQRMLGKSRQLSISYAWPAKMASIGARGHVRGARSERHPDAQRISDTMPVGSYREAILENSA
jgi:hypothetical protein